jgi:hypothetical protein
MQYELLCCICLPCSHAVNISYKDYQPNIKYLHLAATLYFIFLLHVSAYTVIFIVTTEHDTRWHSSLLFLSETYYNVYFYNMPSSIYFLILKNFEPPFLPPYINHVK